MKKKVISTIVLLFVGSAMVSGAWEVSRVGGVLFALLILVALAGIWGLLRRSAWVSDEKPQAPEPDPQRPASDPEKVDYPFRSYGIARAAEPVDFIVLDTETTGFSPRDDKIIEVAALKIREGEVSRFHSLVNPGRRIPQSSIRVHGITDADVAAAPTFAQILPELDAFLDKDLPIVGQSVLYDLRMLWWAYHDAGADIGPRRHIDTAAMAKKAFPGRKSYALASLIHDYHLIPGEQEHRSESDVDATLALYRLCCAELTGKTL